MTDYYAALGVSKNATTDELARAYRQQAQRCHPDHGGSHEAMVRLNEAWEILRDPAARRDYDKTFSEHQPQSTTLSTAVSRAKAQASNYPSRWADFEPWMNSFLDDFTKAQYGHTQSGIPVATGSLSGRAFTIIGGAVGGVLLIVMSPLILSVPTLWGGEAKAWLSLQILITIFVGGGCAVAVFLHRTIGTGINSVRRPPTDQRPSSYAPPSRQSPPPIPQTVAPPETSRRIKITCPHCAQHIEAPAEVIDTVISCPTCSKEFHVGKRSTQPPPIPTRKQPPPIP